MGCSCSAAELIVDILCSTAQDLLQLAMVSGVLIGCRTALDVSDDVIMSRDVVQSVCC